MAEEKEQLRISAELDTSKLKQQARQGLNEVVNEEKKVENQARQTSRAIDAIGTSGKSAGNALQQAGSQGTQALKQVGSQADIARHKINEIAKATKGIQLQQALGVANQFVGYLAPIGQSVGQSLGMSQGTVEATGGLVSGALQGAAAGASLGPWGAVIGGLGGAAAGLIQAGVKLREAANSQLDSLTNTKETIAAAREDEIFRERLGWMGENKLREALAFEQQRADEAVRRIDENLKADAEVKSKTWDYIPGRGQVLVEGTGRDDEATMKKAKEIEDALVKDTQLREKSLSRIAQIQAEIARRASEQKSVEEKHKAGENDFVGPKIPEYLRIQREAEANAFVGPQIPEYIRIARQAEAQAKADAEKNQLTGLKDQKSGLENELESALGIARGYKLTDSLTNVGGGSGYYAQMSGVNSYVKDIATTLRESMKNVISRMDSIISKQAQAEVAVYAE